MSTRSLSINTSTTRSALETIATLSCTDTSGSSKVCGFGKISPANGNLFQKPLGQRNVRKPRPLTLPGLMRAQFAVIYVAHQPFLAPRLRKVLEERIAYRKRKICPLKGLCVASSRQIIVVTKALVQKVAKVAERAAGDWIDLRLRIDGDALERDHVARLDASIRSEQQHVRF